MGRLVDPLTPEEWEKLPAWQKWLSRHWYIPLAGAALLVAGIYFLVRMLG